MFDEEPLVRMILDDVHALSRAGRGVTFMWVPSHVAIEGNERADQLARDGSGGLGCGWEQVPWRDLRSFTRRYFSREVLMGWRTRSWTWSLKSSFSPRGSPFWLSRREQVVMSRLRMGCAVMTHGFTLDPSGDWVAADRVCDCLDNGSVEHVLFQCPVFVRQRVRSGVRQSCLSPMSDGTKRLLSYLRDALIFDRV